ncbi:Hypothetical Protein FCC1311_051022 [Hondaea fermentalgiana]|uniref:Uncharacterized protein n=1 Tax=Hondaea fermentalgiana TaxID=2315210 RepID=A0A2R5GKS7_9STRA|nr:Hypothetical Protein FCC1311_051022 [Hondaea fermentalgiana]|eukprot:GBG28881.1 Hypothetical Protein FCC1311_051022 [Hondaea fermentalgiana]
MFVVSPIVFVAGVRSGQVDRNLLDKMGVASFLEDAGILKKRPIAKPKLGFLAGIFSSPEASFAGDASAMQIKKSHQAQSRAQRHRQDGDGLGTTNGGRDPVAGAPDDDVVVDPNVLAVAQDWLVGMIERVQTNVKHHVLSAFASEDGKSDAGTEKNAGHQASASSASSDVLLTEEDADAVITVEQVQEELAALWKTQQEMFDVFRDQLSQVSIASVLSQHRAAPAMDDDEEDFGFEDDARSHRRSRKSSGSHVKAHTPHEVRTAIERQRAAEEMGRLKVRSSGPVLGVRDMLRGEGLPYDPQIPWASI